MRRPLTEEQKEARRKYHRKYYMENRERLIAVAKVGAGERYKENRTHILSVYNDRRDFVNKSKDIPCADCGKKYPLYCMDFDHVRGEKEFQLSSSSSRSYQKIIAEIAKCDVVCAVCHRIRTHERKQYFQRAK